MAKWNIVYNNEYTEVVDAEEYAFVIDRLLREREQIYPFIGDSRDYHILYEAAVRIKDVPGLTCEIGLRKGGGTKAILDGLIESNKERTHIAIDPYGSIPFEGMDGELMATTEYSNAMQKDTLEKMYRFVAQHSKINFIFFPLEDIEFFERYYDGVPVYSMEKKVEDKYALVHFDGPHSFEATMDETKFFIHKTPVGAMFVYDDVKHFYDHNKIKEYLEGSGWEQVIETQVKAAYVKVK